MLVSPDIQHIVVELTPDLTTPWAHVGFSFAILARPREYKVIKVRQPAEIPKSPIPLLSEDEKSAAAEVVPLEQEASRPQSLKETSRLGFRRPGIGQTAC